MADTTSSPNNRPIAFQGKPTRKKPQPNPFGPKLSKLRKRGVISDKQSKGLSDKYGGRDEPQIDASSR